MGMQWAWAMDFVGMRYEYKFCGHGPSQHGLSGSVGMDSLQAWDLCGHVFSGFVCMGSLALWTCNMQSLWTWALLVCVEYVQVQGVCMCVHALWVWCAL